jgi:hypothetical protein
MRGYAALAVKPIAADYLIPGQPDSARQTVVRETVPFLEGRGFQLESQGPEGMKLTHRYLSIWGALGGLLIFPLGLLVWIFVRREEIVTFSFFAESDGTRVLVRGRAEAIVKKYVDLLQAEHGEVADESAAGATTGS